PVSSTLSLHDALPISPVRIPDPIFSICDPYDVFPVDGGPGVLAERGQSLLSLSDQPVYPFERLVRADPRSSHVVSYEAGLDNDLDRKSTRLNSSHGSI